MNREMKLMSVGAILVLVGTGLASFGYFTYVPCACPTAPASCPCATSNQPGSLFYVGIVIAAAGVLLMLVSWVLRSAESTSEVSIVRQETKGPTSSQVYLLKGIVVEHSETNR